MSKVVAIASARGLDLAGWDDGFMPDNLYTNADKTRSGTAIENLESLVGRAMPALEKPENLRGMQGQVWSETISYRCANGTDDLAASHSSCRARLGLRLSKGQAGLLPG